MLKYGARHSLALFFVWNYWLGGMDDRKGYQSDREVEHVISSSSSSSLLLEAATMRMIQNPNYGSMNISSGDQ